MYQVLDKWFISCWASFDKWFDIVIKLIRLSSIRLNRYKWSKIYINNKNYIDNTKGKRDTNPADAILKVIEGKENNKPYVTYRLAKKMW